MLGCFREIGQSHPGTFVWTNVLLLRATLYEHEKCGGSSRLSYVNIGYVNGISVGLLLHLGASTFANNWGIINSSEL